jgi:hypothetical protein
MSPFKVPPLQANQVPQIGYTQFVVGLTAAFEEPPFELGDQAGERAGEGERSWILYSTLPTSDSGTRRGIEMVFVDGERSEESGEGVDGFGKGGREMRESHGLGTCGLSGSDSPNIRV